MSILKTLGRAAGSLAARGLCTRPGAALVVAGALTLAGGTSWFLGQQTSPTSHGSPPTTGMAQPATCGSSELVTVYVPDPIQLYCQQTDTSVYPGPRATQVIPQPSSANTGQATACGSRESTVAPEINEWYCLSHDG